MAASRVSYGHLLAARPSAVGEPAISRLGPTRTETVREVTTRGQSQMENERTAQRKKICWITPDYFLMVDAHIVPALARYYEIKWIIIDTPNSQRTSDGLLPGTIQPVEYSLRYRQRDPRIIFQYLQILFLIRRERYDLLYTSFEGLPYFFPLLSALVKLTKVIYAVHNVHTPKGAVHERSMRLYQRYAFRVMKRFHVFSRYQLRTISELLPHKRHYYVPFPPDDYGPSAVSPSHDKIRFLFFGYIRRYKRLDLLLTSFKALYKQGFCNIELLIAGSCDDWEYYEPLLDAHTPIHTRIGIVPNKDIPDLVSSCHYVVLPYQDGAQSAVLPLAYRYGKPVIVSDIEAFKEAVVEGSTGFFFDSCSHERLTAVMRAVILLHHSSYGKLVQNVRDFVIKEYSTEDIIARYKAFLDETLDTPEHADTVGR